ncbi:hypothetical protein PTSG_08566 [Salpingoeca rosetta]|uniref:SH2 domain-containing protein n=1 Tax=Salpingoeca rosetta (strain ATCC 50818 / BSB-021) TaxID=946362 RepID=F2UK22_SALR5|nr:uncharacterized protein PTSG_08566 [Salpingoeca rosetta]EGD77471.1 hypothetical protein PTSG_08566 [Salpingoeca rosetta]|eukprot:XP_004990359.1 hypothetical protein PTSG_08566 [Salpingoeca rosetta]
MSVRLREDIYGGPQDDLLRFWLSVDIPRQLAEKSLTTPHLAPTGSFILRRSKSSPGNYAVTVVQGKTIKSYEIMDLGMGQIGLGTGQAFESLETMLDFFYTHPFPDEGNGHVALTRMHPHIHGVRMPRLMAPPAHEVPVADSMYETIESAERHMVSQGALPERVGSKPQQQHQQRGPARDPTYDDIDDATYGDTGAPAVVQQQQRIAPASTSSRVGGSILRVPSHRRPSTSATAPTAGYEGELTKPAVGYGDVAQPDNTYGDMAAPMANLSLYGDSAYADADDGMYGDTGAAENLYGDDSAAPPPPRPAVPKPYQGTGTNSRMGTATTAAPATRTTVTQATESVYGDAFYGDAPQAVDSHIYGDDDTPNLYGDADMGTTRPGNSAMPPPISSSSAAGRDRKNTSDELYDMPRNKANSRAGQVTYSLPQDIRAGESQPMYGDTAADDEYNTEAGHASLMSFAMPSNIYGEPASNDDVYGEPAPAPYGTPASEQDVYGDTPPAPYDKPRSTGVKRQQKVAGSMDQGARW